ncbi:Uncharacterised protein [Bordetella pertussis]|nr:Uncharacterised protein [Bordetella pertussis]
MVQLGFLGLRQRHVGRAVIGAGIDPARIQPQGIEIVREVVVELDLARIALDRVAPHRGDLAHQLGQPAAARRVDRRTGQQRRGGRHHITHAALDIDAALDVVLAQHADGALGQVGQRGLVPRHEAHARLGTAQDRAIGQGQLHRYRQLLELAFHHRQQRIHDFLSPEYERTRRLYRKTVAIQTQAWP